MEFEIAQFDDDNFGGSADDAVVNHVTSDHFSVLVRNGQMQMGTIWTEGADKGEDFEIAFEQRALFGVGHAEVGAGEAADAGDNGRSLDVMIDHELLEPRFEFIARMKTESKMTADFADPLLMIGVGLIHGLIATGKEQASCEKSGTIVEGQHVSSIGMNNSVRDKERCCRDKDTPVNIRRKERGFRPRKPDFQIL